MYDALDLLNEGEIPANIQTPTFSSPIETHSSELANTASKYWGLGTSFLAILFIFQIYFFEAYNLSQNNRIRPWLKKLCTTASNCQLPNYNNIDEISILNGSFDPENNHYTFKAAVINQAAFSQKQPSIKLTLTDFTGYSFASRIFYPSDYSNRPEKLLEPNIANEISLSIAPPSSKVGGYRFELI